jgi:hypothetical protein
MYTTLIVVIMIITMVSGKVLIKRDYFHELSQKLHSTEKIACLDVTCLGYRVLLFFEKKTVHALKNTTSLTIEIGPACDSTFFSISKNLHLMYLSCFIYITK